MAAYRMRGPTRCRWAHGFQLQVLAWHAAVRLSLAFARTTCPLAPCPADPGTCRGVKRAHRPRFPASLAAARGIAQFRAPTLGTQHWLEWHPPGQPPVANGQNLRPARYAPARFHSQRLVHGALCTHIPTLVSIAPTTSTFGCCLVALGCLLTVLACGQKQCPHICFCSC